ncbi:Metallophosphoesterase [Cordyceps fumosorosea ARSEF 2679]|uniref:Metallophosphoesterase n=1 Tax=Cordyceps fumosorosea (strain ARSEF 2679) TaxID=1081104 RepID=A0A167V0Z4_CORFA|nr:Metallophosphoesterase [Cordyceps fumosorosea ARSEF 2679]OAA62108.1 Metallophosphoesterase [Cordyceps fumosorosea ARSEF 2679]
MSTQQVPAKDEPVTTSIAKSAEPSSLDKSVKTSIIILSDTHGMTLDGRVLSQVADVCIHAGDLTEQSLLEEVRTTIALLCRIKAPLKLVIAGNHDFTLDTLSFQKKLQAIQPPLEPDLVKKSYGDYEEARQLLIDAKEEHGIHLLNEGTHAFELHNGAKLRVYASPYTPSLGDWGFQYHPNIGHDFAIKDGTNIVITHGPPRGILDRTDSRERAGCPDLFAAVAKVKPQIHCFGHIHEGWGAKMVAWRRRLSDKPSFLSDIDNTASYVIEQLSTLHETMFDTSEDANCKKAKLERYTAQKYCSASCSEKDVGKTLFVNGSIKGDSYEDLHLPWLVDVLLPRESHLVSVTDHLINADSASSSGSGFGTEGATLTTHVSKKRALDCEQPSDAESQREQARKKTCPESD